MTATLIKRPQERPNELAVLKEAAKALKAYDKARAALREHETHVKALCREYDLAAGVWGFQPFHLRHACEARGLL